MQKLGFLLLVTTTLVFAQFFPNWPKTSESPIAAYVVAGIMIFIVLVLLIAGYLHKNNKTLDDYKFREHDKNDD